MALNVKDFTIELVPISQLVHLPDNANTMSPGVMAELGEEMEEFGVQENIVVNRRNNHIVGGNHRVYILEQKGETLAPVKWVDCDEKQEIKLALALNKFKGKFNEDKLRLALEKLDGDFDFIGFSEEEIFDIMQDDKIVDIDAPDLAPLNAWVEFSFGDVEGEMPREIYQMFLDELARIKSACYPDEKPEQVSIVRPFEFMVANSRNTPEESFK